MMKLKLYLLAWFVKHFSKDHLFSFFIHHVDPKDIPEIYKLDDGKYKYGIQGGFNGVIFPKV